MEGGSTPLLFLAGGLEPPLPPGSYAPVKYALLQHEVLDHVTERC